MSGMVGYWRFEDGSGTSAADSAGNENVGTLVGAPGPVWIEGRVGGALDFDGIDDHINISDHPSLDPGTGDFSFAVWVKPDNAEDYRCVLQKGSGPFYTLYIVNGRFQSEIYYDDGHNAFVSHEPFIGTGEYYHVVVVRDGSDGTIRLYINGGQRGSENDGTIGLDISSDLELGLVQHFGNTSTNL